MIKSEVIDLKEKIEFEKKVRIKRYIFFTGTNNFLRLKIIRWGLRLIFFGGKKAFNLENLKIRFG